MGETLTLKQRVIKNRADARKADNQLQIAKDKLTEALVALKEASNLVTTTDADIAVADAIKLMKKVMRLTGDAKYDQIRTIGKYPNIKIEKPAKPKRRKCTVKKESPAEVEPAKKRRGRPKKEAAA